MSEEGMKALEARMADEEKPTRILALSTCSSDFTDARTILITIMIPHDQGS